MFLKRSGDQSNVLDSLIEKMAKKNEYTIMGEHPGDGGVYYGDSPEEALAEWYVQEQTYDKPSDKAKALKEAIKKIKEDTKAKRFVTRQDIENHEKDPEKYPIQNHMGLKEKSEGVWEAGTYEIKLVH